MIMLCMVELVCRSKDTWFSGVVGEKREFFEGIIYCKYVAKITNLKVNEKHEGKCIDLFFLLLPHDICVPSVCTILYIIYITKFANATNSRFLIAFFFK